MEREKERVWGEGFLKGRGLFAGRERKDALLLVIFLSHPERKKKEGEEGGFKRYSAAKGGLACYVLKGKVSASSKDAERERRKLRKQGKQWERGKERKDAWANKIRNLSRKERRQEEGRGSWKSLCFFSLHWENMTVWRWIQVLKMSSVCQCGCLADAAGTPVWRFAAASSSVTARLSRPSLGGR